MKKFFKSVIGYYSNTCDQMESYFSTAYLLLSISEIFFYWDFFSKIAIIPTIIISIHFISIYVIGYKGEWIVYGKEDIMYRRIFIFVNILVVILAFLVNWKISLICILIHIAVIFITFIIYTFFADEILCEPVSSKSKFINFIDKFSFAIYIFIILMPIAIFTISLIFLSAIITVKFAILILNFLVIPIISNLELNEITGLLEIFDLA